MLLEELVLPLKTDSSLFKSGIAAAGVAVAALVAGMGLAIKATFKWAGELDSIQDIMGVTNTTAAALNFTLRKSGTSTEALTKGMTILSKGLIKADGSLDTTSKSLKAWGIDVLDANGMLKDQTTLIGDISDKYASFGTQQEKVNFLTETFGRSGTELIDFFDTLANDGGIDAVAAKVERLGLAIDPNHYEQFNRSLEELKLVGLGLAVSFTEKVMPVIEKFLEMVSDPEGIDVSRILAWADRTIGSFIDGLAGSIDSWVSSGGPEALSESLISWIEGIGDSEASKSHIQIAMEHLVASMGEALSNMDWSGLSVAIRGWLDGIDATFNAWLASNFPIFVNNFNTSLDTFLFNSSLRFRAWAAGVIATIVAWAAGIIATYNAWAAGVNSTVNTALSTLGTNIENKLTQIAKTFFNRAAGWAQQMLIGFLGGQGALFSTISGMVGQINGLLKKIITSFHLSITFSDPVPGSGSMGSHPPGGGGGGSGISPKREASGGPVFGGNPYMVGEMGPELFVPRGNGAIVPNNQLGQNITVQIDEGRLARVIVQALMQAQGGG